MPLVKPSTKDDYEAEIHELDQKNHQYLGNLNTVNLVSSYGVYADQMELLAFMIEDVSNEYSFSTQGFKVQGFNELIDALKDAAPALADKLRESQKIREAEWRRIDEAEQKRKAEEEQMEKICSESSGFSTQADSSACQIAANSPSNSCNCDHLDKFESCPSQKSFNYTYNKYTRPPYDFVMATINGLYLVYINRS